MTGKSRGQRKARPAGETKKLFLPPNPTTDDLEAFVAALKKQRELSRSDE